MVSERLSKDAEFSKLTADLKKATELGNDVQTLLGHGAIGLDNALTMGEIRDLSKIGPPQVKAAAERLLANYELLTRFMKGDDRMSMNDVTQICDGMRARQGEIRQQTEAQVRADVDAKPLVGTGTDPATGNTTTPPATPGAPDAAQPAPGTEGPTPTPKPTPSTKPGIEGALENLASAQDWIQKEITRLAEEAAKDPSKAGALQAQMTNLTNQSQMLSNMTNQLSQMLSNMTKMWSDIAMNSIRNIK